MTQAVASGEIIGAPCAARTALDLKAQGAPIDFKVLHGQLERAVLRDDPEAGAAPGGRAAARELPGHARRARHCRSHGSAPSTRTSPDTFYATPRSQQPEGLHAGEGRGLQRPWNSLFTSKLTRQIVRERTPRRPLPAIPNPKREAVANVSIRGLVEAVRRQVPTTAIDNLDLEIEPGEFLVLLGPSGCGKTTTLRCIAGLETADEGSIAFGDRTVFDARAAINVPPNKRNIGMVFQSYALWPHMTVRKNIGYPLRAAADQEGEGAGSGSRRSPSSSTATRAARPLPGTAERRPAAARRARRAASSPGPSSCCSTSRSATSTRGCATRCAPRSTSCTSGSEFTAVYVTHDQSEALALGDRLAIMRSGRHRAARHARARSSSSRRPSTSPAFIGMANRLVLERHDGGWVHDGEPRRRRPRRSTTDALDALAARARRGRPARAPRDDPIARRTRSVHGDRRRLRVRRPPHGRRRRRSARTRAAQPHPRRRARQLGPQPQAPASRSSASSDAARRRCSSTQAGARIPTRARRPTAASSVTEHGDPPSPSRRASAAAVRLEPHRARGSGCSPSSALLGYLIVLPLVRLQFLAFAHGAQAYSDAFSAPGIWHDDR